jgi:hypothetical protein
MPYHGDRMRSAWHRREEREAGFDISAHLAVEHRVSATFLGDEKGKRVRFLKDPFRV